MALSTASILPAEEDWQETLKLLAALIQSHPIYKSEGLWRAQDLIANHLRAQQGFSVFEDVFEAKDIKAISGYVDVTAFGSFYADYESFFKRNIIAIVDSERPGPTLLLNGHVDVDLVTSSELWSFKEGWKSGRIIDGKIYGRGACDMLGGLVAMIATAIALSKNKQLWKGRLILTAVTDEEIGGNGTLRSLMWLKDRGYLDNKSLMALVAEPSGRNVALSSLGFMHFALQFRGQALHMGAAKREDNALWSLKKFMDQFESILHKSAQALNVTFSEQELAYNLGIVQGGSDATIPIASLLLEGVIFFPAKLNPHKFKSSISKIIQKEFTNVKLDWSDFFFEGATFPPSSLYESLLKSQTPVWQVKDGYFRSPCDARLFKSYGIPTVIYGPGALEQAHSVDEYLCLNELYLYCCHLIQSICICTARN